MSGGPFPPTRWRAAVTDSVSEPSTAVRPSIGSWAWALLCLLVGIGWAIAAVQAVSMRPTIAIAAPMILGGLVMLVALGRTVVSVQPLDVTLRRPLAPAVTIARHRVRAVVVVEGAGHLELRDGSHVALPALVDVDRVRRAIGLPSDRDRVKPIDSTGGFAPEPVRAGDPGVVRVRGSLVRVLAVGLAGAALAAVPAAAIFQVDTEPAVDGSVVSTAPPVRHSTVPTSARPGIVAICLACGIVPAAVARRRQLLIGEHAVTIVRRVSAVTVWRADVRKVLDGSPPNIALAPDARSIRRPDNPLSTWRGAHLVAVPGFRAAAVRRALGVAAPVEVDRRAAGGPLG